MNCIISVTKKGDILGEKILKNLGGDLFCKSKINNFNLSVITKEFFLKYDSIIFISSTGIAVRAIAKFLKSKVEDPAIIVVDVCNNFTISLVSGHLGGANTLTRRVSEVLGNTAVITTATDNINVLAPDIIAMDNNLIIDDLKIAKVIASRLVNDEEVYFKDDFNEIKCPRGYIGSDNIIDNTVWVTNKVNYLNEKYCYNLDVFNSENKNVLRLIKRNIVLGVGCRKNIDSNKLHDFVLENLRRCNINFKAVALISSIDIKKDEKAILDLAFRLKCEAKFFTKEEIGIVEDKYKGSNFVKNSIGVYAVCEPVIELSNGKIIVGKVKKEGMTLAIGELN